MSMTPDLLKVRACVNRHRGRDYAESVQDRTRSERYEKLQAGIKNTLAGIVVVIVFFAALQVEQFAEEYIALKAEREELIALRTKLADAESWTCRAGVGTAAREIKFCTRAREER